MSALTPAQYNALKAYAESHGRQWKSKLMDDWLYARAPGELQAIRNNFGPTWLSTFQFLKEAPNAGS